MKRANPIEVDMSVQEPGDFYIPTREHWLRYEHLKRSYTKNARTPEEYDAGIRRAVRESGV